MSPASRLEAMLASLADSIEWPTPSSDLPTRVRARIESEPKEAIRPGWLRPAVALAAVLVVTLVMVLSPSARQAVADLLGAAGIRIGVTSDPTPAAGASLGLGEALHLDEVHDAVDFALRMPAGDDPGPPDGVYVSQGGQVTMVWAGTSALPGAGDSDVGLLLTQHEATGALDVGEKAVGPGTDVRSLMVEAQPALWIEGAPHTLTLLDAEGNPIEETTRLAANVLLWDADGVSHRLETTGDLQTALAVVVKLEPLP